MAIEIFKLFGSIMVDTEKAEDSINKTEGKVGTLADKMGKGLKTAAKWGAGIAAGAGVAFGGMMSLVNKSMEATDNIDKMSQKIGISKTSFQEWSYIMGQNGMDVDKLQTGVKTLVGQMDMAASGNKNAMATFEALGITWDDGTGKLKSQEEMLNEAMTALADMENGTEKARLATELFGKAGTEMMPMLNQGSDAMTDLKDRAHDLGLVMSDEAVNSGVLLGDTMDDVKGSFEAVLTKIGVQFMPVLQKLLEWVLDHMPEIQETFASIIDTVSFLVETFVKVVGAIKTAIDWLNKWNDKSVKSNSEPDVNSKNGRLKFNRVDGSHANGLSYVPYDGYRAELHEGERVLTKEQNKNFGGANINIASLVVREEADIKKIAQELYKLQKSEERSVALAW